MRASDPRATDRGFQQSINVRAREVSRSGRLTQTEVLREFLMQRFLARVFATPGSPWILKGGIGLLVRIPGARSSRDVDLLHPTCDFDQAVEELRQLVGSPDFPLDRLRFQIEAKSKEDQSGVTVMKLRATPLIGNVHLEPFPIDLTVGRELVGEIDHLAPTPVMEVPDVLPPMHPFACYPLADQIGDKFAAMYEVRTNGGPSTRWRDLVDLMLIIERLSFDAAKTLAALTEQVRQRPLLDRLPVAVHSPGPAWKDGYSKLARTTMMSAQLHSLDPTLDLLGVCMNPLLDGTVVAGSWDPEQRIWVTGG